MNLTHERSDNTTVEWYTPPELISCLGKFDLDPCTSKIAIEFNNSAKNYFTKSDDGLIQEWQGRVWLNPPYENPDIYLFVQKLALHNNGIALLYNRCDNKMFQDIIFPHADSIFFLKGRIRFYSMDGKRGNSPGSGSILVSFGENNTDSVIRSGLKGEMFVQYHKNKNKIGIQKQIF